MRARPGPPALAVVVAAVLVVVVASVISGISGAEGFVTASLIGSIFAGLIVTKAQ